MLICGRVSWRHVSAFHSGPELNMVKSCQKCFLEFSKIFTYYALHCCHYACINVMLLDWQNFLQLSWNISISKISIRVFCFKVTFLLESINPRSYLQCISVLCCSLHLPLTALLENIVGIKLYSLKFPQIC